jgi:hypothetical protein
VRPGVEGTGKDISLKVAFKHFPADHKLDD